MKPQLLDVLACPDCRGPLAIASVGVCFELRGVQHIAEGVLTCTRNHRFPIIDEVPRLVPTGSLTPNEQEALRSRPAGEPHRINPAIVTAADVDLTIQRTVEGCYGLGPNSSPLQRSRASAEVAYLRSEHRGDNKHKYAALLAALAAPPRAMLDVGGSLPGTLRALTSTFTPELAVVADLDIRYASAFKTADRDVELVRADAQSLPFRPGSFDLVVSAFLLEHVPDWRRVLRSLVATGRQTFVAFGPNRWFPYEIGHLDAPLAGTLPKPLAAYVVYAWLRLTGQPRPMYRIREILAGMNYVSSRAFRRECRRLGLVGQNVFPRLVAIIAANDSAPETPVRRLMRRWPRALHVAAAVACAVGIEPQVYYFLTHVAGERAPRTA